ncbi:MAG TPA: hypothetical protein EYP88_03435 [Anaerolineales bacterium]|nr:hypothetical protein [Anaerolineales bacterium]
MTADNATVNGILTNNGVIRKSKSGLTAGSTTFGITGASINVTTIGNLSTLQVDRVGSAHANEDQNGGGADMLDTYFALTPDAFDQSFDLELCLSYTDAELATATVANEDDVRLCRWTGSAWDCPLRAGSSSSATNTTCAVNVDTFSDWTIGEVGPTAVRVQTLEAQTEAGTPGGLLALAALVAAAGIGLIWRKKKAS